MRIALSATLLIGLCGSAISDDKNDPLFKAAKEGNAKEVEAALANGAAVDAREGIAPLPKSSVIRYLSNYLDQAGAVVARALARR